MIKEDLFRLCREAVEAMPEAKFKYDRLECFAVIRDPVELAAENAGKDVTYKEAPYFFSRRWQKNGFPSGRVSFDFPALFAIELPNSIQSAFTNQMRQQSRIQLSTAFTNEEALATSHLTRPKKEVQEGVYNVMLTHLFYVMDYVSSSVYASVDGAPKAWSNLGMLSFQKSEGIITDFIVDAGATRASIKTLQNNNSIVNADFIDDIPPHKLIGRSLIITLEQTTCEAVAVPVFTNSECCKQLATT